METNSTFENLVRIVAGNTNVVNIDNTKMVSTQKLHELLGEESEQSIKEFQNIENWKNILDEMYANNSTILAILDGDTVTHVSIDIPIMQLMETDKLLAREIVNIAGRLKLSFPDNHYSDDAAVEKYNSEGMGEIESIVRWYFRKIKDSGKTVNLLELENGINSKLKGIGKREVDWDARHNSYTFRQEIEHFKTRNPVVDLTNVDSIFALMALGKCTSEIGILSTIVLVDGKY